MVWENNVQFASGGSVFMDFTQYAWRIQNPNDVPVTINFNGVNSQIGANTTAYINVIGAYGTREGTNTISGASGYYNVYLQRELNTAPTQPGAFTQPTGELEIGDTRTISWGSSTDTEGNEIRYTLDRKIGGGDWSEIATRISTTSFSTVIPTASNIQFRVHAWDGELLSPYRESPTYTVTKPKYYWSKYNSTAAIRDNAPWMPEGESQTRILGFYREYFFVSNGNFYAVNNPYVEGDHVSVGDWAYELSGNNLRKYTVLSLGPASSNGAGATFNVKLEIKLAKDNTVVYSVGTLIQSGLIAADGTYPTDGRHTDGFWYVRGSRVNQSIAPNKEFTAPSPGTILKPSRNISVSFLGSTAANVVLYEVEYRYNSGLWTTLGPNTVDFSRSFTVTTDKTLTSVQFRVRAKNNNNIYSDYIYTDVFSIEHNAKPTISLTTADNPSLTENANLVIAGQAVDTDNGNVLTVYYQINTGTTTAIATGISNGTTPLTYSKTLQFRQGTLYDGTTSVFANLVGNQTYTLKVWAEDNQGGKSDVQTRSFTVVPNRAPIVTVAALATTTDKINNDSITVNGTVTDPDNQTVVVKYKINDGALVQAYSGAGGNYTFNFKLASLNDGDNVVEIQASDVYGLTTTIRRKFTKTKNKKELLESVVRYRGILPAAGITGVVAWFERENGDLTVTPALSLTTTGESETFTNMNLSNTGPVTDTVTEEQYQLATDNPKTGMTLKVNLKRTATTSDKGIKKITGALQ